MRFEKIAVIAIKMFLSEVYNFNNFLNFDFRIIKHPLMI